MSKKVGDLTLYTVEEVSEMLDICEQTVRRYIKIGKLSGKKVGYCYLISENTLQAFLTGTEENKG